MSAELEFQGRTFQSLRCSDNGAESGRDSFYLEVNEIKGRKTETVLEIRYLEDDGRIIFSAFERDLPFELIEYYGRTARRSLTPIVVSSAE
jgi:hypothetical protein